MAKTAEDKIVDELRDMNRQLKNIKDRIEDNKYIWMAISKIGDNFVKPHNDVRPCYISKKSFKDGPRKAMFHKWIEVIGVAQTLALVEYEDGTVEQVKPTNVIFADSGCLFDEYYWLPKEGDENDRDDKESDTEKTT